jgi:hypothetical protein
MPQPYYDTHAAQPLASLPTRVIRGGFSVRVTADNAQSLGILPLVTAAQLGSIADGYAVTKSHGELIGGEWREVIDAQRPQADIDAEAEAAKMPPPKVIASALALSEAVEKIAIEWDVVIDVSSGYVETYNAIFQSGKIPPENQAAIWVLLDSLYRNLDHHVQKWQTGATTWDILPQLKQALETIGE